MGSFHPVHCNGSSIGVPGFGLLHPAVEQIKGDARNRRNAVQPRSVDLVLKFPKEKGYLQASAHCALRWATGHEFQVALHWALRIDNKYFELTLARLPSGMRQPDFVVRNWDSQRLGLKTHVKEEYGTTYMTDDEIQIIGRHFIACWGLSYDALTNNCQSLLIEVCKACLEEPDSELGKAWSGYKIAAPSVKILKPFSHGALKLLGCPKEQRDQWDQAWIDFVLTGRSILSLKRSENYSRLRNAMEVTDNPWRTLARSWVERQMFNGQLTAIPVTLFPYVKNLRDGSEDPFVTNMGTQSQKWTNRATLLAVLSQIVCGTSFARDVGVLTYFDFGGIRRAFARRSNARLEAQIQRIENIGNPTWTESKSTRLSLETIESKYAASVEAVKRFYEGSGTVEDIASCWKKIMKSEDLTWEDVEKHVRDKRLRTQANFKERTMKVLTPKERKAERLVSFTIWATMLVGEAMVLALGNAVYLRVVAAFIEP